MWPRWLFIASITICCIISCTNSSPVVVDHSTSFADSLDYAPVTKLWYTVVEMGKKLLEKLKAMSSIISFLQWSTPSSTPTGTTSPNATKSVVDVQTQAARKNNVAPPENTAKKPNVFSAVSALIENGKLQDMMEHQSTDFHHGRFKRRALAKRKRTGGDEEENEERGDDDDDDDDASDRDADDEEEESKRRRKRRRRNRRRGKRDVQS